MNERFKEKSSEELKEKLKCIRRINNICGLQEKIISANIESDTDLAKHYIEDYALTLEKEVVNNLRLWWTKPHKDNIKIDLSNEEIIRLNEVWQVQIDILEDEIVKVTMPTIDNKKKKKVDYLEESLPSLISNAIKNNTKFERHNELLNMKEVSILYLFLYSNESYCGDYDNKEIKLVQDILSSFFFFSDSMAHINTFFSGKKADENKLVIYITARDKQKKLMQFMR